MNRWRRPPRIRGVWHVGCTGHAAVLIVVRNLGIVARSIWVHVAILIHGSMADLLLLLVILVVVVTWILRCAPSPSRARSRKSHIDLPPYTNSSAVDYTSCHGLPSRQMITVHLAGLGLMKQWLSTASAT